MTCLRGSRSVPTLGRAQGWKKDKNWGMRVTEMAGLRIPHLSCTKMQEKQPGWGQKAKAISQP